MYYILKGYLQKGISQRGSCDSLTDRKDYWNVVLVEADVKR